MKPNKDYDYLFKVVLIGDQNVGNSSILCRLTKNSFSTNTSATYGVEFSHKTKTIDGKTVKTQIWDTSGQEKFRATTSTFYRGAVGALVIYDITNEESFIRVGFWANDLKSCAGPEVAITLVGNKADLGDSRVVTKEEGWALSNEYDSCFIETSALSGVNIETVFEQLICRVYENTLRKGPVMALNSRIALLKSEWNSLKRRDACSPSLRHN